MSQIIVENLKKSFFISQKTEGMKGAVRGIFQRKKKEIKAIWTICGNAVLFIGLITIQAAISFWTIESLEIMNTLTYGELKGKNRLLSQTRPLIEPGWR